MTEPRRIQLSRAKGWRMPENTVKVDRSNKDFGNPFAVYATHFAVSSGERFTRWSVEGVESMYYTKEEAAAAAVARYRARLSHEQMATVRGNIEARLRGKNLACWCAPDAPCHADVLLEIANPKAQGERDG